MPSLSLPEDDARLGRERTGGESPGGASAASSGGEPGAKPQTFPIPSPPWRWGGPTVPLGRAGPWDFPARPLPTAAPQAPPGTRQSTCWRGFGVFFAVI